MKSLLRGPTRGPCKLIGMAAIMMAVTAMCVPQALADINTAVNPARSVTLTDAAAAGTPLGVAINEGNITTTATNAIETNRGPATVTNSGNAISRDAIGIRLKDGGYVDNTGYIFGGTNGVTTELSPATVVNSGTVSAILDAFDGLTADQAMIIKNSGIVTAQRHGLYGADGSELVNSGIINVDDSGIVTNADDSVMVLNSGELSAGDFGAFVGGGSITNTGDWTATNTAVIFNSGSIGGTIKNEGTMTSSTAAVVDIAVDAPVTTINSGEMNSGPSAGAILYRGDLTANQNITNEYGGTINSGSGAAISAGYMVAGSNINNSGDIFTAGGAGINVSVDAGGNITNTKTGQIIVGNGNQHGIQVGGSVTGGAVITNDGLISAASATSDGVNIGGAGNVVNQGKIGVGRNGINILASGSETGSQVNNSGIIDAGEQGIYVAGEDALIESSGKIIAGAEGIFAEDVGTTVLHSGDLQAVGNAIVLDTNAARTDGSVINSGSVLSTEGHGVQVGNFAADGTFINTETGVIVAAQADKDGFRTIGLGSGRNDGLIKAGRDGMRITSQMNGDRDLINTGRIEAGQHAIHVGNGSAVDPLGGNDILNQGELVAQGSGIYVNNGNTIWGTITNAGLIDAMSHGIYTERNITPPIHNTVDGTILAKGEDADGIHIGNNGSVDNDGLIRASRHGILVENIGSARNDGVIAVTDGTGIRIINELDDDVLNCGEISAGEYAVHVGDGVDDPTNGNNIINRGVMLSCGGGIYVDNDTAIQGDIHNFGVIEADGGHGISTEEDIDTEILNAIGASIVASGDDSDGINIGGEGDVLNEGSIQAEGDGVYVNDAGNVNNRGSILSGDDGIRFGADGGEVKNYGSVDAGSHGIVVLDDADIYNYGMVYSRKNGLWVNNDSGDTTTGEVYNAGEIYTQDGDGIRIVGSIDAEVVNDAKGIICANGEGNQGIALRQDGNVRNNGLIEATGIGIEISGQGSVFNTGDIDAGEIGVLIGEDEVNVFNSGTIRGDEIAINLQNLVRIQNTGELYGGTGILTGNDAIIENAGRIETFAGNFEDEHNGAGIYIDGNGEVLNTVSGVIISRGVFEEADTAIHIDGSGFARNQGLIESDSTGIFIGDSGGVDNSGTIIAGDYGIDVGDESGVLNSGTIVAHTGIYVDGEGIVENSGTIESLQGGTGIYVDGDGEVFNTANGVIKTRGIIDPEDFLDDRTGIRIAGSGVVVNHGLVDAADTIGVVIEEDGEVENHGDIYAGLGGILVEGSGEVFNTGTVHTKWGTAISTEEGSSWIINHGTVISDNGNGIAQILGDVENTGTVSVISSDLESYGIRARNILNTGDISFKGPEGVAVFSTANEKVVDNCGSITAEGIAVTAVEVRGDDSQLLNSGPIVAKGDDSIAVSLSGISESVTSAQTLINTGLISAMNISGTDSTVAILADKGCEPLNGLEQINGEECEPVGCDIVHLRRGSEVIGDIISIAEQEDGGAPYLVFGDALDGDGSGDPEFFFVYDDQITVGDEEDHIGFLTRFAGGTTILNKQDNSYEHEDGLNPPHVLSGVTIDYDAALLGTADIDVIGPELCYLPEEAPEGTNFLNNGRLGGTRIIRLRVPIEEEETELGTLYSGPKSTIAPGNSIGTIEIDGNLVSAGTLEMEIRPIDPSTREEFPIPAAVGFPGVDNDLIKVTSDGTAEIVAGSTVDVIGEGEGSDYSIGSAYAIVITEEPGNLIVPTGADEGDWPDYPAVPQDLGARVYDVEVKDNLKDIRFLLLTDSIYDDEKQNLYLVTARNQAYQDLACTENTHNFGCYFDHVKLEPEVQDIRDALDLIALECDLCRALQQMTGEIYGTFGSFGLQRMFNSYNTMATLLRPYGPGCLTDPCCGCDYGCNCKPDWSVYGAVYGLNGEGLTDGNAAATDYDGGGGSVMLAYNCDAYSQVGGYFNYDTTELINTLDDRGNVKTYDFGGFFRQSWCQNYYFATVGGGWNEYNVTRAIDYAGQASSIWQLAPRRAHSDYEGYQLAAYIERGWTFGNNCMTFQPYIAMMYMNLQQYAHGETGAYSSNLCVDETNTSGFRSILGAHWDTALGCNSTVNINASWMHEWLDTRGTINARLAAVDGPSFTTHGLDLGRDWAVLGARFNYACCEEDTLFIGYNLIANERTQLHAINAGAKFTW